MDLCYLITLRVGQRRTGTLPGGHVHSASGSQPHGSLDRPIIVQCAIVGNEHRGPYELLGLCETHTADWHPRADQFNVLHVPR